MKELHHISSQAVLETLIERYFNGDTTLEEECELRWALSHCPWESETIDDARVVMGYFAAHRHYKRQQAANPLRRRMMGIAASIAVILTIGGYVLWHQSQPADQCIAYVNGVTINDDAEVMALIENDLSNMDNAAQGMASQLSSLGEALETEND